MSRPAGKESTAKGAGLAVPASARPGPRCAAAVACAMAALAAAVPAAGGQEGGGGTVDVFRGPVVGSSRVVGLGGAYTAIAEGTCGGGVNTASLANRYPYSVDWFDWDWNLDWVLLLPGTQVDMDNDGEFSGQGEGYLGLNVGLGLQFGRLGVGIWVTGDTLTVADEQKRYGYGFTYGYFGAAWAFWDEQMVAGLGAGTGALEVTAWTNAAAAGLPPRWDRAGQSKWTAGGLESGFLWRPRKLPLRVGAGIRQAIVIDATKREDLAEGIESGVLPDKVQVPWRIATGIAYCHFLAGHRFNTGREEKKGAFRPQAERAVVDRRYLLAAFDLIVTGPAPPEAVGTAPFVTGEERSSGSSASVSVHTGVESEVMSDRLVLRAGAYLEPPRLAGASWRLHGTSGIDVRLFRLFWWDLRGGVSVDLAPRYGNAGIGLGFWH